MFVFGLDEPSVDEQSEKGEEFTNIGCFILMLDICIKQVSTIPLINQRALCDVILCDCTE